MVNVGSADIMASLVSLKKETELKNGTPLKLTLAGATEAHIIAEELAEAGVGVIVTPTRSFVSTQSMHTNRGLSRPLPLLPAIHMGRTSHVSPLS